MPLGQGPHWHPRKRLRPGGPSASLHGDAVPKRTPAENVVPDECVSGDGNQEEPEPRARHHLELRSSGVRTKLEAGREVSSTLSLWEGEGGPASTSPLPHPASSWQARTLWQESLSSHDCSQAGVHLPTPSGAAHRGLGLGGEGPTREERDLEKAETEGAPPPTSQILKPRWPNRTLKKARAPRRRGIREEVKHCHRETTACSTAKAETQGHGQGPGRKIR